MKIILQKVSKASVTVEDQEVARIDKGYCLLVGVHKNSTEKDAEYLAKKISNARLFEDEDGKINLSLKDVGGSILSVSQFTLYADVKKGSRPSFSEAAPADVAQGFYEKFNDFLRKENIEVKTGIFQTHMEVVIVNDGPITITYERLLNK